jgi:hypothetical protein
VHGCAISGPKLYSRSNDHLYVTWSFGGCAFKCATIDWSGGGIYEQRNSELRGLELIKFDVSSVLAKLGARSRTEAVKIGILRGLVAI